MPKADVYSRIRVKVLTEGAWAKRATFNLQATLTYLQKFYRAQHPGGPPADFTVDCAGGFVFLSRWRTGDSCIYVALPDEYRIVIGAISAPQEVKDSITRQLEYAAVTYKSMGLDADGFVCPSDQVSGLTKEQVSYELAQFAASARVRGLSYDRCTCETCPGNGDCPWAFDLYNTDGDCLAQK